MGLPLQAYTDEGAEFVKQFEKMKYYDVEHKRSRTPPAFVERSIRTVKEKVLKRQKNTWNKKAINDDQKFLSEQESSEASEAQINQ